MPHRPADREAGADWSEALLELNEQRPDRVQTHTAAEGVICARSEAMSQDRAWLCGLL